MNLTYKYRLQTTKMDREVLVSLVESQRVLYNAALQERRDAYKMCGKSISLYDQCKSLTLCRADSLDMSGVSMHLQRGTLKRLDRAFKSFFRRVETGQTPGFPRFKSKDRFHTLEWDEYLGIRFDGNRIYSKSFARPIRVKVHRPVPENTVIKTVKIVKNHKAWYVCFDIEIIAVEKSLETNPVGIDVGIHQLAALSTGELIANNHYNKQSEQELRVANRRLARAKRGSNRRKKTKLQLQRVHAKIKNRRQTYLHQVSERLTKEFNPIVVEKLNVRGMIKNQHLSKYIADASWSTLIQMLEYKAEKAGKRVVKVDPRNTSQDCSGCGFRVKKLLSERIHTCMVCGLILDRDINAARNILNRGVPVPEEVNVSGYAERSLVNIS